MLSSTNPFLQLAMPRTLKTLGRLKESIWTRAGEVECSFGGNSSDPQSFAAAVKQPFKPVQLPFVWGQVFDQGWFELSISNWIEDGWLLWRDDGEGTLYVDGVPFYGFDVAHRFCPLPRKPARLHMESLCLQSAIWHPEATLLGPAGSRLTQASVYRRNDVAWDLYHDFLVLTDLVTEELRKEGLLAPPDCGVGAGWQPSLERIPVMVRTLLRGLDDAVNALDSGGLPAAKRETVRLFSWLAGRSERQKAILTGHAHIDLVWLWPEKNTYYKGRHTFATMTNLMERYPEFRFNASQPALYEAIESDSPALMEKVRERIRLGQWEALGAMYVESDTLMACGEALARSFLLGQSEFTALQGHPSPVLWLPDVFGYSACLPQIMRESGVEYFFTTKLTWSNINRFPHSSFVWRGHDGSEVLVHVTQETGYNQSATVKELRQASLGHRQSDIHPEFLAPTGFGDGGGGVTEEMCERARRLKDVAGMPEATWGSVAEFFERMSASRPRLPVWQGELYLEYHRGTLTSHSDLKHCFRAGERALQTHEAVRVATQGRALDSAAWKRMVFSQFHDFIPGSSIWEVYEEGCAELTALAAQELQASREELHQKNGREALFNPLPLERVQVLEGAKKAVRLGPVSGAPVENLPEVLAQSPVMVSTSSLGNSRLKVDFDSLGRITCMVLDGREVAQAAPMGEIMLYPDFPHNYEAWDIDRQTLSLGQPVETSCEIETTQHGPLEASLSFRRKLGEKSEIKTTYRLNAFESSLRIDCEVDWHESQTLLKMLFPTAYSGKYARFGTPFGSVLRDQHPGDLRAEAMFESAASRWLQVGYDSGDEALAIITEAKYGVSCREGLVGVSLLRGVKVTGEDLSYKPLMPGGIRRGGARETLTDQGTHHIRLALAPQHPNLSREESAAALADLLFTPNLAYHGETVSAGLQGLEGGDSLIPCWCKPAELANGWVLRLHEVSGRSGKVRLKLDAGHTAERTNLLENCCKPLNKDLSFEFRPYELISIAIRRSA